MLTIYTGHHLNTVTPNIDIELSHLDAPETTIQKAADVFEQSKDTPVIIRTNDILFLDTIKALAMEQGKQIKRGNKHGKRKNTQLTNAKHARTSCTRTKQ